MTPELSRPVTTDRIGAAELDITVTADATECAALARRMQVPGLLSLRCAFRLVRLTADTILAEGHLQARMVRTCVITLEDFETGLDEAFRVRFVPAGTESDDPDPEADDEIGYEDAVLDLGEAAAEQLALTLDPYPRAPGAELPDMDEAAAANPFAALRRH